MIRRKIVLYIGTLALFMILLSGQVQAEERSIFVGDLIDIRITTQEFNRDELIDKFADFEIVNEDESKDGYLITLRSFEPGKRTVVIGNKEIIIDIKSTLDEIQRDDIFEGDLTVEESGSYMDWKYVFYVLLLIFLVTGGVYFFRHYVKKKIVILSPIQQFTKQMNDISDEDIQYAVKLTLFFKEYIEATYSCRIKGKTSSEIIGEIRKIPGTGLSDNLKHIISWLEDSDRYKFSGIPISPEGKQQLHERLVNLVRSMDEHKESDR